MMDISRKWDLRGLDRAAKNATYSKDPTTQVGAVLMRPDKTFAGDGFNGFPAGLDDDPALYADRDYKIATVIHAEENSILNSRDVSMEGYTLYVSGLPPCAHCASMIIQKGIGRVVAHNKMVPARWAQNMKWAVSNMLQKGIIIELYAPGLDEWREVYRPEDLWIEGAADASCDTSQVCGCAA
jgi:dCMP deaminase